jgi:adenylate cyclase
MKLGPLEPNIYDSYSGMAYTLFMLRRYEEALAWANKALHERPLLANALRMRAMATAMLERPAEEVRESTRRLLDVDPRATVSTILATAGVGNDPIVALALRKAGLPE